MLSPRSIGLLMSEVHLFRPILALSLACLLVAQPALAFSENQLQLEFDARLLSPDEKRFLQAGLAFANTYNGLIDGAWGPASQRALEGYEAAQGRDQNVTNGEVLVLAISTYDIFEQSGWERQYNSALDMSFLVPSRHIQPGTPSENFVNMEMSGTSLGYSLKIGSDIDTAAVHQFIAEKAVGEVYRVTRPELWISSSRTAEGLTLYARSHNRRGIWSTVLLSAGDQDAGILAAVTGSIALGYAPQIGISSGVLSDGVETMAKMLEPAPRASTQAAPSGKSTAPNPPTAPGTEEEDRAAGFGSGFLVSKDGDYITNSHVVAGCKSVSVDGMAASVIATDDAFDLALLRAMPVPDVVPAEFAARPARLNSDVTVIGYPLPDILGGLNVTRGAVTSLKGLGGDGVRMQISAPVQPGNSGGPVVNAAGQIVGVVVSKLDAQLVQDVLGDIPQNVNFAIRAEIAKLFLYQNGVEPVEAVDAPALAPEDLAERAEGFTVLISCD